MITNDNNNSVIQPFPLLDLAEDLLGPNIRFHHSKLNFKWHSGGEAVEWHQDIQFWPHTNYGPLTVGVFLEDVTEGMGNVGFVPGSHLGELFDQYAGDRWGDGDYAAEREYATVPREEALPTRPRDGVVDSIGGGAGGLGQFAQPSLRVGDQRQRASFVEAAHRLHLVGGQGLLNKLDAEVSQRLLQPLGIGKGVAGVGVHIQLQQVVARCQVQWIVRQVAGPLVPAEADAAQS